MKSCVNKFFQAIVKQGLDSNHSVGFALCQLMIPVPEKLCVSNFSEIGKFYFYGQIKQKFCSRTLSKVDLKHSPNFNILPSNTRESSATLNKAFFSGCHHL